MKEHKVIYFELRFSSEMWKENDLWSLINTELEKRFSGFGKGFRVMDLIVDSPTLDVIVKCVDNSTKSFREVKTYFRNKKNEQMGLINGYRATAHIEGDICTVKPHLGILFRPYDHYKVTKSGYLTGYWKPYNRNKPEEWPGGFRKWEDLKFYRDQLVQVPFREFEVIESDDVVLKLKIK